MVVKVAMADHFQFKVMPSIKNFCLLKQGDVHYIGGTDILPAPLGASEERWEQLLMMKQSTLL